MSTPQSMLENANTIHNWMLTPSESCKMPDKVFYACWLLARDYIHSDHTEALHNIAALGDTGSDLHRLNFDPDGIGEIPTGWRVAEKMREIALEAIGEKQ